MAFNIGIHFFDMLLWIFGPVVSSETENLQSNSLSGKLELSRAEVKWFLSTDIDDVPLALRKKGQRTYRSIKIQGRELEFSQGFTELHKLSYQEIINGKGFGLKDAKPAFLAVNNIIN